MIVRQGRSLDDVPAAQEYKSQRVLQLRAAGDPGALAPLVAREIRALDPDLPIFDVTTMERMIEGSCRRLGIPAPVRSGGGGLCRRRRNHRRRVSGAPGYATSRGI